MGETEMKNTTLSLSLSPYVGVEGRKRSDQSRRFEEDEERLQRGFWNYIRLLSFTVSSLKKGEGALWEWNHGLKCQMVDLLCVIVAIEEEEELYLYLIFVLYCIYLSTQYKIPTFNS